MTGGTASRPAPRRALVVLVALLLAGLVAGGAVALLGSDGTDRPGTGTSASTRTAAADFLDTYVDDEGRVVRTDQGGDTVSEGQAYAMLIAVGAGDEQAFAQVWDWTQEHLRRPDGLLSWRWEDGQVVDESSASDADLDAARALVLAADAFDEPAYREDGVALGESLLAHETVETPAGLVLVAGQWATTAPYSFNPSYVSPVATDLLQQASGDPRWSDLAVGSRAALDAATPDGQLPPDWAQVTQDGSASPVAGPSGQPVQFGYDAARTLVRQAESCDPTDRAYAAEGAALLGTDPAVAVYDLAGSPQTTDASPLMSVAQAAAHTADGDAATARTSLRQAAEARERTPTYYGDAWAVLGPMLLEDDTLGGCAADADGSSASGDTAADDDLPLVEVQQGRAAAADPVAVRVPSLGITSRLDRLGVRSDGELETPPEWQVAGWYDGGPRPGETGPAVIAGHVDSPTGPAVFTGLSALRPGDLVEVDDAVGTTRTFRVDRTASAPKRAFPTQAVYGPTPDAQLRLITCDGAYDASAGGYQGNLIVFATEVDA